MVKKKLFAAALTGAILAVGTLTVSAEDSGLQPASAVSDFSYYISGTDVVVSYDGSIEMGYAEDTNVIIGVYDNGELVNMKITNVNANKQSYSMDGDMVIHLAKKPEKAAVKMFIWSADGKIIPKKTARGAAEMDTVSLKTADITEFDYSGNKLTADTTRYSISDNAQLYVNEVDSGTVTDDSINKYICDNYTGSVTLVDFDSNGVYDRICVDYYVTAVVDSTAKIGDDARIYFKMSEGYNKMQWSPDADITFIKDGKKIDYSELKENDVLSIKHDVINYNTLTDLDFCYVLVSSESVTGTVTSRDSNKNTVRVDGIDYQVNPYYDAITDMELSTKYRLYIDVFGTIAYIDELYVPKNYGVIISMQQDVGKDYPTVTMITANGEIVSYECCDSHAADDFYNYVSGTYNGYNGIGFTKEDIADKIGSGQTVCTYKINNETVTFDKTMPIYGGPELEYNDFSKKLGPYKLDDDLMQIIDIDEFMSGDSDSVYTMNISDFEDKKLYTAYMFDKNAAGDCRFAMVVKGTYQISPTAALAVVQNISGATELNGTKCTRLTIAQNGEENIELFIEGDETELKEGSVFAYTKGHAPYVKQSNFYQIMTPDENYDAQTSKLLEFEWFSDGLNSVADGKFMGKKAKQIYYDGTPTYEDCYLYFGPVHFKNNKRLELLTDQHNSLTNINKELVDIAISDSTLSYVYDYSKNTDSRVSVSPLRNSAYTRFDGAYTDDGMLSWTLADDNNIHPDYALAKVVDGTLTELISFVAPDYDPPQETDEPALALVKEVDGEVTDVIYYY